MEKSALEYGRYYHIYNRGNNSESLFKEPDNYRHFLSLYKKYIIPIADTLAYCLMTNHIHVVVRIKEENEIRSFEELHLFEKNKKGLKTDRKPTPSHQFAHLFNAYSKAINKHYNRTGSLFEHPFERRIIESEPYLQSSISYTHYKPVKARIVDTPSEYTWSSYNALISDKPTHINRELVMTIFGDKDYFILYHSDMPAIHEFVNSATSGYM